MKQDDSRNIILSDTRSSVRIQLKLDAMYSIDETSSNALPTWYPCTILNISAGGVLVATMTALAMNEGEDLSIRFNIGQEYSLSARIVWEQHFSHAHHYGLSWNSIPVHTQEHLMWVLTRLAVRRRRMRRK